MRNRKIQGVGVTDCNHKDSDGKNLQSYNIWFNMIKNVYGCYKDMYRGFSVCESWHSYKNFKSWYDAQHSGNDTYILDRYLLPNPNHLFSPETCCLMPKEIKQFISVKPNTDNNLPLGVHYCQERDKYVAQGRRDGKVKYLGAYESPERAHAVYAVHKIGYARFLADKWRYVIDSRVYDALMHWRVSNGE